MSNHIQTDRYRIWPYAPFTEPVPVPDRAFDDPDGLLCLKINKAYIPYLLGLVGVLIYPDMFEASAGETAQKLAAQRFINLQAYLTALLEGCIMTEVRQNSENPCILEYSDDDGETWAQFANLQLCPPLMILGQDGLPEVTSDGGATYHRPDRPQPPAQPTPPVGEDSLCLASQNVVNVMVATYEQTVSYFVNDVQVLIAVAGVISLIALFIFFPPDFPAALTAFIELWTLMTTITADTFDSDKQHTFLCDLKCHGEINDGVVTFNYNEVLNAVNSRWGIGGINAWTLVSYLLVIIGADGLNWAATAQSATTADCSDCGCNCDEPIEQGVPYQDFPVIPIGILAAYNQVVGQGGLWYADAEGDGGTWTMTLDHTVLVTKVAFACNSYGGAEITITVGGLSHTTGYGGLVVWELPAPTSASEIVIVQSSIPSNIRLSFNSFEIFYC